MTECKKMKKMMVEAIPNDLTEDERRRFHKHLKICAGCAKEYKKLTELMGVMNKRHRPQMSQAFWDNYTNRLDEKMVTATEKREPVVRKFKWRQWILYPATALAILIVGITIGRHLPILTEQKTAEDTAHISSRSNPAVVQHFGNVKPLLIDYNNYTPDESDNQPKEMLRIDKNIVERLLIENQLLKRVVAKGKNIPVQQLLEDLELILLEISAASNGEVSPGHIRQLIERNDILLKMKVFVNENKNISKI